MCRILGKMFNFTHRGVERNENQNNNGFLKPITFKNGSGLGEKEYTVGILFKEEFSNFIKKSLEKKVLPH